MRKGHSKYLNKAVIDGGNNMDKNFDTSHRFLRQYHKLSPPVKEASSSSRLTLKRRPMMITSLPPTMFHPNM